MTTPTPQQIEGARKLARLTRRGFAALIRVDASTIYRWERAISAPSGAALRALNITLDLLRTNSEIDLAISATIAENK